MVPNFEFKVSKSGLPPQTSSPAHFSPKRAQNVSWHAIHRNRLSHVRRHASNVSVSSQTPFQEIYHNNTSLNLRYLNRSQTPFPEVDQNNTSLNPLFLNRTVLKRLLLDFFLQVSTYYS